MLTQLVKPNNPSRTFLPSTKLFLDTRNLFTQKLACRAAEFVNISDYSKPPPELKNQRCFSKLERKIPSDDEFIKTKNFSEK